MSVCITAWIGSLSLGAGVLCNFLTLDLLNKYEHRTIVFAAGILYAVSMISSSFTTSIGQIYFTYGILGSKYDIFKQGKSERIDKPIL